MGFRATVEAGAESNENFMDGFKSHEKSLLLNPSSAEGWV
jgi:hypothetical protein